MNPSVEQMKKGSGVKEIPKWLYLKIFPVWSFFVIINMMTSCYDMRWSRLEIDMPPFFTNSGKEWII